MTWLSDKIHLKTTCSFGNYLSEESEHNHVAETRLAKKTVVNDNLLVHQQNDVQGKQAKYSELINI